MGKMPTVSCFATTV